MALDSLSTQASYSRPWLDRAAEYAEASDAAGRRELARLTIASKRTLPADVVEQLAADRVDARTVIILLEPHLNVPDDSRLFALLRTLGGKYAQLASVGRDHPTVDDDPAHVALLRSLITRGIVSTIDTKGAMLVVNKKHK